MNFAVDNKIAKLGWLLLAAGLIVLLGSETGGAEEADGGEAVDAEGAAFFEHEVLPILEASCFSCHAGEKAKGEFQLDTRSRLVRGGESGTVVDFEDPEAGTLLEAVRYEGYEMPPRGKLPDEQIAVIERWVAMGVPYPADRQGDADEQRVEAPGARVTEADRQFWAFQPLSDPLPPTPIDKAWGRNPVDAFVAARREDANLKPNPPAAPAQLLRRLHYDLTGLPPSQDLVQAFVADPSPLHYERIVDRLLATPEYGERWGRHWLDLVRYAETNSYERDDAKPEVWRYRDYVIDSFNRDKPFDTFAAEQLAGDEMEYSAERLIATGFYRLGIWDDEPADRKLALYDDLDDIVATTSQVFLGLTVNCARCHEHKIDPIMHADYYRWLAFFSGINRYGVRSGDSVAKNSLRGLAPPAESREAMAATRRYREQLDQLNRKISEVENKLRPTLVDVEKEEFRHEMNRPEIAKSRIGKLFDEAQVQAYGENLNARRELQRNKPDELAKALCVTEIGSEARPTFVLTRGNPHAEAEPVTPGFPVVLGGGDAQYAPPAGTETSGRRTALAAWVTDHQAQPMTARVTANRLWQYHFGRGLVRTPNDFGFQGTPPTHPQLLDFLASRLVEHDWHLKPIHRLLVLSSTYQMQTRMQDDAFAVDPINDTYWRFDPRRLSAEEIRDSMLAASGQLDFRKHGPSIYPVIEAEVLAGQSRPGHGWGNSSEADRSRRSIYIHIKRSLAVPLLAAFDAADADFTCPVRFATTQPTQALGLMNGRYSREIADKMARDVRHALPEATPEQLTAEVLRRVTQREPTADEIARGLTFIESLRTQHQQDAETALELFCLLSLNLNEFVHLD
ncbi:PSD1 and planctomycete cytochrome C domain-containing protein [Roseimaritima ulvae]|uniref:Planctomycete cytochrome C n=1 Tax=Roseimaritima ulvae TaxID=980254 RepID=A0A5B9QVV0_9BACT|nr:PSD1 and planctomycete cytochrome C domain-containing protein [Roseimaritima ulvae]QEG42029.1 Planctomycete cytochrome C [Roseimaritima ulvae]